MPKVEKTVKVDPEVLERVEKLKVASGGIVTFAAIARAGISKELADLEKKFGK
ncbi:MAG: hypothetical protein WC374_04710 [Phycisphaerae bacterium]|jgi:hypothetical protein